MDDGKVCVNEKARVLHESNRIVLCFFTECLRMGFDPMVLFNSAKRIYDNTLYKPFDECKSDDEKAIFHDIHQAEEARRHNLQEINSVFISKKEHESLVDIKGHTFEGEDGLLTSWLDLTDLVEKDGSFSIPEVDPICCFFNKKLIDDTYKTAHQLLKGHNFKQEEQHFLGTEYKKSLKTNDE